MLEEQRAARSNPLATDNSIDNDRLRLPKLTARRDELVDRDQRQIQDRPGNLPNQPVGPLPPGNNPQQNAMTAQRVQAAAKVRTELFAKLDEIDRETDAVVRPIIMDIALGKPGATAELRTTYNEKKAGFDTACKALKCPQFDELDKAETEIKLSLKGNNGQPETNPAIIEQYKAKLLLASGRKDFGDIQVPATGWTEATVSDLVAQLKYQRIKEEYEERVFVLAVGKGYLGKYGEPLESSNDAEYTPEMKALVEKYVKRVGGKDADAAALRDRAYEKYGKDVSTIITKKSYAIDPDLLNRQLTLPPKELLEAYVASGPYLESRAKIIDAQLIIQQRWPGIMQRIHDPRDMDPEIVKIREEFKKKAPVVVAAINDANTKLKALDLPPVTLQEIQNYYSNSRK